MPKSSRFPLRRRACAFASLAAPLALLMPLSKALAAPPAAAPAAKPAVAAVVVDENPYAATVPVDDESAASRDKGLRLALIEVLKRVVGRADAATSGVLARAPTLVQQYGFSRDAASGATSFRAVFDPRSVDEALKAAGLPVFGVNADVVEAWIVQVRGVRSADDYARVIQHFSRIRGVRGVDVAELGDQGLRLKMVVEGGTARVMPLAEAGGLLRSDGAGGYVLAGR